MLRINDNDCNRIFSSQNSHRQIHTAQYVRRYSYLMVREKDYRRRRHGGRADQTQICGKSGSSESNGKRKRFIGSVSTWFSISTQTEHAFVSIVFTPFRRCPPSRAPFSAPLPARPVVVRARHVANENTSFRLFLRREGK